MQYLLTTTEEAFVDLFAFGLLQRGPGQTDPTRDLRAAINTVCLRLLPNAVGFTDAFSFSDWSLDRFVSVCLMGWIAYPFPYSVRLVCPVEMSTRNYGSELSSSPLIKQKPLLDMK